MFKGKIFLELHYVSDNTNLNISAYRYEGVAEKDKLQVMYVDDECQSGKTWKQKLQRAGLKEVKGDVTHKMRHVFGTLDSRSTLLKDACSRLQACFYETVTYKHEGTTLTQRTVPRGEIIVKKLEKWEADFEGKLCPISNKSLFNTYNDPDGINKTTKQVLR